MRIFAEQMEAYYPYSPFSNFLQTYIRSRKTESIY